MSQDKPETESNKRVVLPKWTNTKSSGCFIGSSPPFILFLSPVASTLSRLGTVAGSQHGWNLSLLTRRHRSLALSGSPALRRFEVLIAYTGFRCLRSRTRVDSIGRRALLFQWRFEHRNSGKKESFLKDLGSSLC